MTLRSDQKHLMYIRLLDLKTSGTASHGIHVSDCSLGYKHDTRCRDIPASISLHLDKVVITEVGLNKYDAYSLGVNKLGSGNISAPINNSRLKKIAQMVLNSMRDSRYKFFLFKWW